MGKFLDYFFIDQPLTKSLRGVLQIKQGKNGTPVVFFNTLVPPEPYLLKPEGGSDVQPPSSGQREA
jgi:hypothetical protein